MWKHDHYNQPQTFQVSYFQEKQFSLQDNTTRATLIRFYNKIIQRRQRCSFLLSDILKNFQAKYFGIFRSQFSSRKFWYINTTELHYYLDESHFIELSQCGLTTQARQKSIPVTQVSNTLSSPLHHEGYCNRPLLFYS